MKSLIFIMPFFLSIAFLGISQSDSLFENGVSAIAKEDYKKAVNFFISDIDQSPTFESYYNLGIAEANNENWIPSLWAFESSLKYRPNNGSAQFNADLIYDKVESNKDWEHPFSWYKRVIASVNLTIWIALVVIFSLFSGVMIFILLSHYKKFELQKWSKRLIIPFIVIFCISLYGGVESSRHYNQTYFLYPKSENVNVYIKPNGVMLKDQLTTSKRYKVLAEDDEWLKIYTNNNLSAWIKKEDALSY